MIISRTEGILKEQDRTLGAKLGEVEARRGLEGYGATQEELEMAQAGGQPQQEKLSASVRDLSLNIRLKEELQRAADIISQDGSLSELLQPWTPPDAVVNSGGEAGVQALDE